MKSLIITLLVIVTAISIAASLVLIEEIFPGAWDSIFGTEQEYDENNLDRDADGNIIEPRVNEFQPKTHWGDDSNLIESGN